MIFIILWWFVRAHKWFKGPKINIEVSMSPRKRAAIHSSRALIAPAL